MFYLFIQRSSFGIDLTPWPALQSFMERIAARPAVKAALAEEGLQA